MTLVQDYISRLEEIYQNHGMYVGTANGERTLDIAGNFFEMEKNYGRRDSSGNPLWYNDAARDYEYLAKCYRKHYDMSKSRAGDCSGIIVGVLRDMGLIGKTADYSAKMFQKDLSDPIPVWSVMPGDWVFDKESNAGHIGTYVGEGMVIDSRGRDVGIVKRSLEDYAWKAAGRPKVFASVVPPLTRELKYVEEDMMKGEDVKQCQQQLVKHSISPGIVDGVFGVKTRDAVAKFQTDNNLGISRLGVVGQKTWNALFTI